MCGGLLERATKGRQMYVTAKEKNFWNFFLSVCVYTHTGKETCLELLLYHEVAWVRELRTNFWTKFGDRKDPFSSYLKEWGVKKKKKSYMPQLISGNYLFKKDNNHSFEFLVVSFFNY